MRLALVLLAAGLSRRYGKSKILEEIEGSTMLERAMKALPAKAFSRAVLIGSEDAVLDFAAAQGYLPVGNPHPARGISSSIALGLEAIGPNFDGVLFAVCDQPWLTQGSVARLISAFSAHPNSIVALGWQGVRGNPVIFPQDLLPALLTLRGDTGGSAVIARHPERLRLVEALREKELLDVDTPPGR